MSKEIRLKHQITEYKPFLNWAIRSTRGEFCIYHRGNLAADRLTIAPLSALADLVMILHERGYVIASQWRQSPGHPVDYVATRTGEGSIPRGIVRGDLTPNEYRVLKGLSARADDTGPLRTSLVRSIKQILHTPNEHAAHVMAERVTERGFVDPGTGKRNDGWRMAPAGMEALL